MTLRQQPKVLRYRMSPHGIGAITGKVFYKIVDIRTGKTIGTHLWKEVAKKALKELNEG